MSQELSLQSPSSDHLLLNGELSAVGFPGLMQHGDLAAMAATAAKLASMTKCGSI